MRKKSSQHKIQVYYLYTLILCIMVFILSSCKEEKPNKNYKLSSKISERQITFTVKNHSLDNNDNYSPGSKYLCYDTRGTVYKENIGNTKTIEKVNIETGAETILWKPESVSGEDAAPGVGAVSWHPTENKVAFIHGPSLKEVKDRGYYNKRMIHL